MAYSAVVVVVAGNLPPVRCAFVASIACHVHACPPSPLDVPHSVTLPCFCRSDCILLGMRCFED